MRNATCTASGASFEKGRLTRGDSEKLLSEQQTIQILPPVALTVPLFVFRLIEQLTKELCSKEAFITELCGEKNTLTLRVGELEGQVQELSSSLLQKDKDVEVLFFISALNYNPQ